jgi:hypothetical protein
MPEMPENSIQNEEQLATYRFFSGEAYTADINALRQMNPELLDYATWLQRTGWANN